MMDLSTELSAYLVSAWGLGFCMGVLIAAVFAAVRLIVYR